MTENVEAMALQEHVQLIEVFIGSMVKERGVIMTVLRAFIASLKPRMPRQNFMGEDYNGTKYYEDPHARHQRGRSFVPTGGSDFMQDIPAEWESWLRYRRRDPPTKEEVDANLALILMKQKNAAELEKIHDSVMKEEYGDRKPLEIADAKAAFPTYDEYRNFGQSNEPQKKVSEKRENEK